MTTLDCIDIAAHRGRGAPGYAARPGSRRIIVGTLLQVFIDAIGAADDEGRITALAHPVFEALRQLHGRQVGAAFVEHRRSGLEPGRCRLQPRFPAARACCSRVFEPRGSGLTSTTDNGNSRGMRLMYSAQPFAPPSREACDRRRGCRAAFSSQALAASALRTLRALPPQSSSRL